MEAGRGQRAVNGAETSYRRSIRSGRVTILRGRRRGLEIALAGSRARRSPRRIAKLALRERPASIAASRRSRISAPPLRRPKRWRACESCSPNAGIELRALAGRRRCAAAAAERAAPSNLDPPARSLARGRVRRAARATAALGGGAFARSPISPAHAPTSPSAGRRGESKRSPNRCRAIRRRPHPRRPRSISSRPRPRRCTTTATLRGGQALHHVGQHRGRRRREPRRRTRRQRRHRRLRRAGAASRTPARRAMRRRAYTRSISPRPSCASPRIIAADDARKRRARRDPRPPSFATAASPSSPLDQLGDVERGSDVSDERTANRHHVR